MVYERRDAVGWWFHYLDPASGNQRQKYAGASRRKAEERRQEFLTELKRHISPQDLFNFVDGVFLVEHSTNVTAKSLARTVGILNDHLYPTFGGPMHEITPEQITSYKRSRLCSNSRHGKTSPETVLKELRMLKQILSAAIRHGRLAKNPFDRVKMPRPSPGRVRYLQPAEWTKLLAVVPHHFQTLFLFMVHTGCRRSEALALCWTEVDLANGFARISRDKANRGRVVNLNPTLVEALRMSPRAEGDDRVFFWCQDGDYVSQVFRQAVRVVGISNFRLHDLRHTFASWVRMAGHDIDLVAKLLGHSDLRMSQRYAHLSPKQLKEATGAMEGLFMFRAEDEGKERVN